MSPLEYLEIYEWNVIYWLITPLFKFETSQKYRVFIEYCVFLNILENILNSGPISVYTSLYTAFTSVSVFVRAWPLDGRSGTRRSDSSVQKINNILRKNTIFNEHSVLKVWMPAHVPEIVKGSQMPPAHLPSTVRKTFRALQNAA